MLSISHSLTGALVAVTLRQPLLYVPTIFASHYLEDWIPHWDVGTGLTNGKRKRSHAIIMELAELGVTGILLYWFFQFGRDQVNWLAWIGGGVALIPDFVEAPRNFLKKEPWFFKPLNDLHQAFHHSTPNVLLGLTPQVILWAVIWMLR
jgi:hypothetical protein